VHTFPNVFICESFVVCFTKYTNKRGVWRNVFMDFAGTTSVKTSGLRSELGSK
jgi:hypothetical protein